jgi:hypothetical protein
MSATDNYTHKTVNIYEAMSEEIGSRSGARKRTKTPDNFVTV